jgi:hypothetical protein
MRHLVYSVRYSVVRINSSLLTKTLYSSVTTTLVYHHHHHHHHHPSPVSPHRAASASSNSLFKGQVVLVHLVYNSALFSASACYSFLVYVAANFISIFLVSRQLVLISAFPKFLRSFSGQKKIWQLQSY